MKDEKIVYEFPSLQEITRDIFAGFDEEEDDSGDTTVSGVDIDSNKPV